MKNTFGTQFTVSLFGESHGPAVGVVIDGIAPGIPVDMDYINAEMDKRRAKDAVSTARREADEVEFLSGVYNGHTTGTSLTLVIHNKNTRSQDYMRTATLLRPGHADYTAQAKYLGFQDPRGGGHFSARLTTPIVAAGAFCRMILERHGVLLGTHIARCGAIDDIPLPTESNELRDALQMLNGEQFAVLSPTRAEEMRDAILAAKANEDSIGGILETAVVGLPAGLGEPFFGSVESVLAELFFSIPGIKGLEFGAGFGFADMKGSEANDPFRSEGGGITTTTNHNGGVNGGITNGMPVVFRAAVKPTPSISQPQQTVDIATGENAELNLTGRHDPCILPRARAVADAMTAIGLVDLFSQRFGVLWQCS